MSRLGRVQEPDRYGLCVCGMNYFIVLSERASTKTNLTKMTVSIFRVNVSRGGIRIFD
jgi:hypothetical protein